MFILTDSISGGVYAVYNKDQVKTVQIFEDKDDAIRYNGLLEASGHEETLEVFEVDLNVVAANCKNYGYFYTVVTKDDFVIPPHDII